MRRVRIAASARAFFQIMLEQGAERFGVEVAMAKERLVYEALSGHVVEHPDRGVYDAQLGLRTCSVRQTPFILVYEYDDDEVRVLFIVHERADRRRLDLRTVVW